VTTPLAPDFQSALSALTEALRSLEQPAALIGGLAVIARGVPRFTIDIDAIVQAEGLDVDRLWSALRNTGFQPCVDDAAEFARQRQVLLLRHTASGMPVDVSLGWLTFERETIDRATPVDLGGVWIPVALPEDLVIFKAIAWRDVGKSDITELIVRHHSQIDMERVRRALTQFYEILEIPERLADFEQLVSEALAQD
jgi:hypothetical protein